jgi:hypothetical protein
VPEAATKRLREGVEKMTSSADILKFGITEPAERKFEKFESSTGSTVMARQELSPTKSTKFHEEGQRQGTPGAEQNAVAHPVIFDLSFLNSPIFDQKRQVVMTG